MSSGPKNKLERAREFAAWVHEDQRYGEHPYTKHLADVAALVAHFGGDENLQVAAWLHDSIEDTRHRPFGEVDFDVLAALFGRDVANLVEAVTNEEGKSRAERHAKTWPKIRAAGDRAVLLKLCDRVANMSASTGTDKADMYIKDNFLFVQTLRNPETNIAAWNTLLNTFEAMVHAHSGDKAPVSLVREG